MAFRGRLNHDVIVKVSKVCFTTANRLINYSQQIYDEKQIYIGENTITSFNVCE